MANLDLSKYGIQDVKEIIHNPSYDVLFAEETKPGLEGFEKGQVTELGAVNVMTGIYTCLLYTSSGNHHLVIGCADRRHPQGSLYLLDRIRQFLTHFIRHYLSNAFNITAETHTVALDCYITNFCHVLVQDRICLGKVDNLHNYRMF